MTRDKTHFGYQTVDWQDKADRVRDVFDSVASKYDLMNDLMSGGLHRLWKQFAIEQTALRPGQRALDVAGGTGDLSLGMANKVGEDGTVVLTDINTSMLSQGRSRLIDNGFIGNIQISQANAECLPFADDQFDCVLIAFGLRNVTDKPKALADMYRVLRPGGRLLVLEFSHPVVPGLKSVYDMYSFKVLPWLGEMVADDAESYRYLAESIRMHPDQDTLIGLMDDAGFDKCSYHNLTGGIVALHKGIKF
ncbi:MAG: bifunctional demethylmenaquinone methyltransferase/2-methoxy-6-polyprenyl-1,4-benzoquinol methylase UbiE [Pseudomonadota bacterium]